MIDYAIQPNSEMMKFVNWCNEKNVQFEWIDHHITAIENLKHFNIPGLQHSAFSGCLNTWHHLNGNDDIPDLLKIVNDFDVWNKNSKYSWKDEIFPVIYYLNSLGTDLNDNNGELVQFLKIAFSDNDILNNVKNIGLAIQKYVKSLEKQNLKKVYEREWNGYNCLVLNSTVPGSMQFEEHPEYKNVDLLVTWSYDGKYYYYGIYSLKSLIDVGDICRTYFNGGGHKSCGGGQIKDFLFF